MHILPVDIAPVVKQHYGRILESVAYHKILAQEIEDSVQTAIEEWGGDRATVEVEIAKTIHELFDVFGEKGMWGASAGYSRDSRIGPVDFVFSFSDWSEELGFYFNFGFYF